MSVYRCQECGLERELVNSADAVRYDQPCPVCKGYTLHERVGYDPTPARPVQAEKQQAEAAGWYVNDDGNLAFGGGQDG